MNEQILGALTVAAVAIIGAIGTLIVAGIDRLRATIAVDSAKRTAESLVESAISDQTEGAPVDEGGAVQVAEDYLRASVGRSIQKLGGNAASIGAGIALGVIARKGRAQ